MILSQMPSYVLNESLKHLKLVDQKSIVQDLLNDHLGHYGKLVRPALSQLFGEWLHIPMEKIIAVSKAAEFIHSASLIHDDVVDEATIRRNRPTLNSKISNARAVLAGDFLLAQVIRDLVDIQEYQLLKNIAQALKDMVEGEFLQDDIKEKMDVTQADLIQISEKKTGALFAWAIESMAILSNQEEKFQKLAHNLGLKVGIIFQMMDDNLDYSHVSGKDFAKDLKEGILNFTSLELMSLYPELGYPMYQLRGREVDSYPWSDSQIQDALLSVENKIQKELEEAHQILNEMNAMQIHPNELAFAKIKEFINYLVKRSH
ncbi:MAG: polyprenyl synthetase family protein [Bacteriovoracaceae bacterium]|nr:polyprenyl synthetase family protein [Bacteriovoracaceae bacterium]